MLVSMLGVALSAQSLGATPNRFDLTSTLPGIPAVRMDKIASGVGIAQQTARAKGLQARILWVDATANIDTYNTPGKIEALVQRAYDAGFNTISFDVKPIIGYTMYPSKLTPQLTAWRGKTLPEGFDPIPLFVSACHRRGMKLFVCLNAFSEGHRMAREQKNNEFADGLPGPGYDLPDQQSVQVRFSPALKIGEQVLSLSPTLNTLSAGAGLFDRTPPADTAAFLWTQGRLQRYSGGPVQAPDKLLVFGKAPTNAEAWIGQSARVVTETKFVRSAEDQNQIPLMMNPFHPEVKRRSFEFAQEIAQKYDVDGLLYDDRLRFTGMDGDFSPLTQELFAKEIGQPVRFPEDIFTTTYNADLTRGIKPGKFWDAWWAFRAREMARWVDQVTTRIRAINDDLLFGIYAGSWYGEYDNYGANYAASDMNAGFPFLTRAFRQTGFADKLDLFIAGCYYRVPTIFDAMTTGQPEGRTVEAASIMANRVINDEAWTVAGIALDVFAKNPGEMPAALQAAVSASQGVMVFDHSHNFAAYQDTFAKAFARRMPAPYESKATLQGVRKLKRTRKALGSQSPPVFIYPGAPGAGH